MTEFKWQSEVKDSELDIQGIVNNAIYFVYMEHCRHKHAKSIGADFIELHKQGIDLIAMRCEIEYKNSLTAGDEFIVTSLLSRKSRLKIIFHHQILRIPDQQLVAVGKVEGTAIERASGKFVLPDPFLKLSY